MRQDSATCRSQSTPERGAPRGNQSLLPRVIALVAMGAIFGPLGMSAQKSKPREFEVKATYLYNFARFVEWPTTAAAAKSDSFAICVLGQDPFGPALDAIVAGETIGGKAVLVKRVLKPQEAVSCGVLYISSSEETRLREVLAGLDKAAVLTVSDIPQFSQRGGMIQFVQESNKIRFEVNLASAEGAGLTLSSELLKVAVLVRKNSQPGD
jgi:YfiR/HmsC-like